MTAWKFVFLAAVVVVTPALGQEAASSLHYVGSQTKPADANKPSAPANKGPADGAINGHSYTSNFFHLSFSFPEGWNVISTGASPQVDATGATAYVLLIVGSADRQMHGTRWITIGASRPPAGARALSAEDYAKLAASVFKQFGGGDNIHLIREPTKVRLGKRDMTRFDLTAPVTVQGTKYDTQITYSWTIERGYLLMFVSSDPAGHPSDDGSAAKALNSLTFFETAQ